MAKNGASAASLEVWRLWQRMQSATYFKLKINNFDQLITQAGE
jgi:hypothetical protein